MNNIKSKFLHEWSRYTILLRSVPGLIMALFVISCVMMNLMANKEIELSIPYLALDCGFLVSWLSFLTMDVITTRFGPKAAIQLSITACAVNLLACSIFFITSRIVGHWAEFYTYEMEEIDYALNSTFGGAWYVVFGSTCAFIVSAIVNAFVNHGIGKLLKPHSFRTFAVRSYVSTFIGQFVDNMVFSLMVGHIFFGWTILQCVMCSLTGCIAELFCEVIFGPVGYMVNLSWEKHGVGTEYLNTK